MGRTNKKGQCQKKRDSTSLRLLRSTPRLLCFPVIRSLLLSRRLGFERRLLFILPQAFAPIEDDGFYRDIAVLDSLAPLC